MLTPWKSYFLYRERQRKNIIKLFNVKGRPDVVVRAVSLSHQVAGSKQPLRRFSMGKACLGFSFPPTPLMWEPPALGLPFLYQRKKDKMTNPF